MFEQYEHHGKCTWVRSSLKGKHRECCLCFDCRFFNPEDRESNCPKANALYFFDIATGLTTPVFECADFEEVPR